MIGYHEIAALLPHRFPFQFIDRVLEFEDGVRIVALKNVSINEPFFRGHFPEQPLMPGVLICEALAQAGALLAHRSTDGVGPGRVVRARRARSRPLPPPGASRRSAAPRGDLAEAASALWKMHGTARVDGQVAAEADLSLMETERSRRP